MTANTTTPLALYKANLEFALRISALLQENRRCWLALGESGAEIAVDEVRRKVEETSGAGDWNAWVNLSGEAFWKTLQRNVDGYQVLLDATVGSQIEFSGGLRVLFTAWREQCKDVLQEQGGILPFAASFNEFEKQFRNLAVTSPDTVEAAPTRQKGRS